MNGYDFSFESNYDPWYVDTINQAIKLGAGVAQVAVGGYPPGSTVVYAPQTQLPGQPQTAPLPLQGAAPQQPAQGIQLSQTTLMLLVGGVLLFMLGGRKR